MKVFISGQKYYGREVLRLCLAKGLTVVGVCCPPDDQYLGKLAFLNEIPIVPAGTLTADNMPACDLGITAHSFDYIGKRARYKPKQGWIGYHPSLLPRHRGRSSIEWALRMRDAITGGTVFWLNGGIDRGDIAYQDWLFVDPELYGKNSREAAGDLWREELMPMGLRLMERALTEIKLGIIQRRPQDSRFSTFEPSLDVKDIYKPDALMLPEKGACNA